MAKKETIKAYQTIKTDIENLMSFISSELDWHGHDSEINWSHVSSLNLIKEKTLEILAKLMDSEVNEIRNEIQEALEEARL